MWIKSLGFLFLSLSFAWAGPRENALRLRRSIEASPFTNLARERREAEVIKLPVSRGFDQKDSQLCWTHSFFNALETMELVKHPARKLELSRAAFQRRTMEDRLQRRLDGTDDFMSERGTPMDALALARRFGLVAWEDYTDIVLGADGRYARTLRAAESTSLQEALDGVFAPWPQLTRFAGRSVTPLMLAEELLKDQQWVAFAPGNNEGWGDHPDTDARPETRAYEMSQEKIINLIREALRDQRPVTYGGNGHSVMIYGASYDETGRPLKYFIKDCYPSYFYEAAPSKLHREMLEVTLVVKTPPAP
jgi:hypothetical protein